MALNGRARRLDARKGLPNKGPEIFRLNGRYLLKGISPIDLA